MRIVAFGVTSREVRALSLSALAIVMLSSRAFGFTFTTIDFPGTVYTEARGINPSGQIVGFYEDSSSVFHGFLLINDAFTTIDVPGATLTLPEGINPAGQIVGSYQDSSSRRHGFLLDQGRFTSIDVPGATFTDVHGIDPTGRIVGEYITSGAPHGFLLDQGRFSTIDVPGALFTMAYGINASGQIVGSHSLVGGFLLNDGTLTTVNAPGHPSTEVYGINPSGQMVGSYLDVPPSLPGSVPHGFVLDEGTLTTIDVPGALLTEVHGINALEQLVGVYVDRSGRHGFVAEDDGTLRTIHGRIEAEDYDRGGPGIGYADTTPGNEGAAYRDDDVDIKASREGGYAVGWFTADEWLAYTVNVQRAGTYVVQARVGSALAGRTFHVEIDGRDVTGPIAVPQMADWDQYDTVAVPGLTLRAGVQTVRVVMGPLDYMDLQWIALVNTDGPAGPFAGQPWPVPGRIEAENYDLGGQGVGYADSTAGNDGQAYRTDDVDIKPSAEGGYAVGWFTAGEWLAYTVNVRSDGMYTLQARVGSALADRSFHVEIDGQDVTGPIAVPQYADWDHYGTVAVPGLTLHAGVQVVRVVMGPLDYIDLQWIALTKTGDVSSPLYGTPWPVPGRIEAEDYDLGGPGVGYYDSTPGNEQGQAFYRTDNVDIKPSAEGGFAVGWFTAGEWLAYTVGVQVAGTYTIQARVGSALADRTFYIEVDGSDATGPVAVPQMADWDQYDTVTAGTVSLSAGTHVLRVVMGPQDWMDFQWLQITP